MNQEVAACIRIAISDTINHLRPPVMGVGLPEPIRTALQAHLDSLLKAEREALTQQAEISESSESVSSKDPGQSTYERIWLQATKDLEGAMALVQNNSEFFGARCGDDKIKVISEFFAKWAAEKLQAAPWYPDDSGDWVEGHPRDLPPDTPMAGWLYKEEREKKNYEAPGGFWLASELTHDDIVAYKVAKP